MEEGGAVWEVDFDPSHHHHQSYRNLSCEQTFSIKIGYFNNYFTIWPLLSASDL